jgi:hypothetical protein
MEHFYQKIPGWFDYEDVYLRMVSEAPNRAHFVEVGTYQGRSAAFMAVEIANSGKSISFDCIDPFTGLGGYSVNLDGFRENMSPVDGYYRVVAMKSPDASMLYGDETLDFVWLDGDHSVRGMKMDVPAWLPKIKPGGYFGGHDYAPGSENGVHPVVSAHLDGYQLHTGHLFESHGVQSWLWRKPPGK